MLFELSFRFMNPPRSIKLPVIPRHALKHNADGFHSQFPTKSFRHFKGERGAEGKLVQFV